MPVEIRELIIKATVSPESTNTASVTTSASNNAVSPGEEIINTCVEKVLQILKEKYER